MKKAALLMVKLVAPAALFTYLLMNVPEEDYAAFWRQSKRWELLAAAQLIALTAITVSFLRWFLLVRAFEIPFSVREALRLGFLGYLLNFISFGSVGGDLFKAILVARDKPERRPEAVASVLLDRAIGLLGLIILAWASLVLASSATLPDVLVAIRNASGIIVVCAGAGILLLLFAGNWFDSLVDALERIPLAGRTLTRMARAVRRLRQKPQIMAILIGMSILVHTLLATTIFLISAAIYRQHPPLTEHLMVVPPGMAAGALPIAPGGVGVQEGVLGKLFDQLPDLPNNFSGLLVATVYRLLTVAICGIGLILYWMSHGREMRLAQTLSKTDVEPPEPQTP